MNSRADALEEMAPEMVLRVAKALAHRHHGRETQEQSWETAAIFEVEGDQDEFLTQARVAISALREPTEAMAFAIGCTFADESMIAAGERAWQAGINAALTSSSEAAAPTPNI